jgi:nitrogen fixation/metabolism regulation signal transduction histidine kinase
VRQPLRLQILWPLLAILILAIACVSATHVWLTARSLKNAVNLRMRDAARTLAEGTFPLEANVLRQASQLSGAELAVSDERQRTLAASNERIVPPRLQSAQTTANAQPLETLELRDRLSIDGREYLYAVVKLDRRFAGQDVRWLHLFYPEVSFREARWQAIYPSLVTGGLALAAAIPLATFVAARVTMPVQKLQSQVARIAQGEYEQMPLPTRDDELRDLSLAVNQMAQMLRANAEELRRHERAATLHQLGAGIAHQLRNAATGCRMALDLFRREEPRLVGNENLAIATRQLELMEHYLQRFLTLGRTAQLTLAPVEIWRLVQNAANLVRPLAEHLHVTLEVEEIPSDLVVEADATSLEQVLVNLLANAIEACADPQVTQREVRVECIIGAAHVQIVVSDHGLGFRANVADQLGEPFVTTKPQGTGLGLAVAKEIIREHDGRLEWERRGEVTRFVVELALARHHTRFDC